MNGKIRALLVMIADIQLELAKLYNHLSDEALGRAANDVDLIKELLRVATKRMELEAKRRKK